MIDTTEERARVANDTDSPYVDLNPMTMPEAIAAQPGEEGYQAQPDAWTDTFSHIADTGGLLPPPAPNGASSSGAWAKVMGGVSETDGVGYKDGDVTASPEAWEGAAAGSTSPSGKP